MSRSPFVWVLAGSRAAAWAWGLAIVVCFAVAPPAAAAPTGKIQGRIVGTDNGEPIGFADVLLVPADTTLRKVGGLTNADGTYLLEAAPGRYALQFRALSYATKRVEGIVIKSGELLPLDTGLSPEALQQDEIVVEAKARQNTESALLNARKKASTVSDAVSAEQVRKSPDKDAAEVLRRVTGLSVSDGKYVFVRGLGERYSSTEVDGVRIASPEQNKRVVPLDLVPANLLDNIVVQKTYTADRPGEFGGGDVQVHTKDFPGRRTWSFSVSQAVAEGATFQDRRTYFSGRSDVLGFGSDFRAMPGAVANVVIPRTSAATRGLVSEFGKSFRNVWSPSSSRTIPNASYSATYGDELKLFGRSLGMVQSWSLSRSFDKQHEAQRFYQGSLTDTVYDYAVTRWTEAVQLGGLSAWSYRLSPRHSIHLRGIYTNNADDEVRLYEGLDHNFDVVHRNTRLTYVQRTVLSGVIEGRHEFSSLLGTSFDWKFGRSEARRRQPDRREYTYDQAYYFEGDTAHWTLASRGTREFGDMRDDGWGSTFSASLPYRLGRLGSGKLVIGHDRQTKERTHFYRRFNIYPNFNVNPEMPPESLFAPGGFDGSRTSAFIEDATNNDLLRGLDNYNADQRITASFVSLDMPLGRRARANLGLRDESGFQNVRNFALFQPEVILAEGRIDQRDLLPSASLTVGVTEAVNLRLAASRTVSRPDLNELSPTPFFEYIAGMRVMGNPSLNRARLDNYDVRVEAFPGLGEVLAAGFFYKRLHDPIEQTLLAGSGYFNLIPRNSDHGRNQGIELEARAGLGRLWKPLTRLSVNANASFISSKVTLQPAITVHGSQEHPLQGQADHLFNGALSYTTPGGTDVSLLVSATGKRLRTLAIRPLPDIYQQPFTTLDATMNLPLLRVYRVKLAAKNLLDPRMQWLQGEREAVGYRAGRSYSVALTYGS